MSLPSVSHGNSSFVQESTTEAPKRFHLGTLGALLLGHSSAIRSAFHTPALVWLGLLFVLSAGFAREYDAEPLLKQPWHLLLPLAASLVTSAILYGLVWCVFESERLPAGWSTYRGFLTLYWMTAPLAWLYAIPMERLLSAPDSVRGNLGLLAVVSIWRVLLITRCISVLFQRKFLTVGVVVMLFADTLAVIATWWLPVPILNIMGGIRLTESESIIQGTAWFIRIWGALSWPAWFAGALAVFVAVRRRPSPDVQNKPAAPGRCRVGASLWIVGGLSLLVWIPILPKTQVEQVNRWEFEQRIAAHEFEDAIQWMATRQSDDFPPHWDPPPRLAYGDDSKVMMAVIHAIQSNQSTPSWIKEIYAEKLYIATRAMFGGVELSDISNDQLQSLVLFLPSVRWTKEIARELLKQGRRRQPRQAGDPVADEFTLRRQQLIEQLEMIAAEPENEPSG